jgi:hypothetical protein
MTNEHPIDHQTGDVRQGHRTSEDTTDIVVMILFHLFLISMGAPTYFSHNSKKLIFIMVLK